MIKIIDAIPDHKPHCGNCDYFTSDMDQEEFGLCDLEGVGRSEDRTD